jgi:hypothetical protein
MQGAGSLAGQQHRNRAPDHAGPEAIPQGPHQHAHRSAHGLLHVDVRRGAIGGEDVDRVHNALRHVAVQVVADRDLAGRPNSLAHRRDQIALGVLQALDIGRPMHGQIDAVERSARLDPAQKFVLDLVVELAGDWAPRDGPGVDDRREPRRKVAKEREIGRSHERLAAQDREIRLAVQHRVVGAALDVKAADGDAHSLCSRRGRLDGPRCGRYRTSVAR